MINDADVAHDVRRYMMRMPRGLRMLQPCHDNNWTQTGANLWAIARPTKITWSNAPEELTHHLLSCLSWQVSLCCPSSGARSFDFHVAPKVYQCHAILRYILAMPHAPVMVPVEHRQLCGPKTDLALSSFSRWQAFSMHAKWWCFHHGNSSGMNEKSMSVSTRVICFFVSTSTKCSFFGGLHLTTAAVDHFWQVNNVASRASCKIQEEVNNAASRAPGKSQEEVNNVASTASGKFQEEVNNVTSRTPGKFQEKLTT